MKCYRHNSDDAIGQCNDCTRGLCAICSEHFNALICDNCALKSADARFIEILKGFAFAIAIFVAVTVWFQSNTKQSLPWNSPLILMPYMLACIPFGWVFLKRVIPQYVLTLHVVAWILLFILRLWSSAIIGGIIAPYVVYKAIQDFRALKKLKMSVWARMDQAKRLSTDLVSIDAQ